MPGFGPLDSTDQSSQQVAASSVDINQVFERTQLATTQPATGGFSDRIHNRFGIDLHYGNGTPTPDINNQRPIDVNTRPQDVNVRPQDVPCDVKNGVLTLKYGDPDLDKQLAAARNYNTIHIETPPGVSIKHWVDQNGYFFWFQNGNDNGAKHYYPPFAKQLWTNGHNYDLEAQRLKVDEQFAQFELQNKGINGGFSSLDKKSDVMNYVSNMSKLSGNALQVLERNLTDAVRNSDNPYFKIYLADVYTAEAMLPIRNQVLNTNNRWLDTNASVQYLDKAIALLNQVNNDSRGTFAQRGWNPSANIYMPLDPYSIYRDPRNTDYMYGFWVGSYDQARFRAAALTTIKNMIGSGVRIELP